MRTRGLTKLFLAGLILLFLWPSSSKALSVGERVEFFVDSSYDLSGRDKVSATLKRIGGKALFYIDEAWWAWLDETVKDEVESALFRLDDEFETKIYPVLTSIFGSEWKPGIDAMEKITLLLHPMARGAKGYYRTGDEYLKLQIADSNEREMVYLNANHITEAVAKSYLAHEFQHLITFNQKERGQGVADEVWLQELISEVAITLLGYDDVSEESNLARRVETFLKNPNDSLTEWHGQPEDYGVLNLFGQYLLEQYGQELLVEALHSPKTGIDSLETALAKKGFRRDFAQTFRDWQIAVLINDCSLGRAYCYESEPLADLRVGPSLNFLPYVSKTSLKIEDTIKDWSGRWYKLVGGRGSLTLNFDGLDETDFHLTFWACPVSGECQLETLALDEDQQGEIRLPDFGSDYTSLTLILSTQEKRANFGENELAHPFFFEVVMNDDQELIRRLLNQIALLKAEIAKIQAQIAAILADRERGGGGALLSCSQFDTNLSFGMRGSEEVRCLQDFLKGQGQEIYPEGLITGNFLSLTREAVIRFQQKYAAEILMPLELEKGTGFVGPATRAKINQLLRRG